MDFNLESLKELEKKISDSTNYVTTYTEIYDYLGRITERYAKNTAVLRLSKFEMAIYSSYICHENPIFETISPEGSYSFNNLSGIHYLMFRFLTDKSHRILIYQTKTSTFSSIYDIEYSVPSFSWKIPYILMPFLAAYIVTCTMKKRSSLTPSSFFENLKTSFSNALLCSQKYISNESLDDMNKIFLEWADNYLGRKYFTNLDKLSQSFSQNKKHRDYIASGVQSLTNVLLNSPVYPNPIPYYINLLLEDYIKAIKEHTTDELFPRLVPWEINDERTFIRSLTAFIMFKIRSFRDFIHTELKKHHIADSKYELAVDNSDIFIENILENYSDMISLCSMSEKILRSFFDSSNTHPDIQKAIANQRLSVSIANEEKHIKLFTEIINTCIKRISKELDHFFKLIILSSSAKAASYKKVTVEQNYYSAFKRNIYLHTKHCIEDLVKKSKSLPAPFYYHDKGVISHIGFSNICFSEKEVIKIITKIKNKDLGSEYIHKSLQINGFQFPMSARDLVTLLLNFNKIFSDHIL